MKYFSMFSGIGGFELGIGDRGECVGYSEVDKYAIQIYKKHFPSHINWGDAREIRTGELPEFDLLVGGFPCQAFSVAGKRKGFDDTRGTLFFEIARILEDKRPRHFLLENVAGLLYHENGETFKTILRVLTGFGYRIEWQVLNSKDFGVPQKRNRVFIVGYFGKRPPKTVFPIRTCNGACDEQTAYSLDCNYLKGVNKGNKVYRTLICVPLKYLNRNQRNYTGEYAMTVDTCNTNGIYDGDRLRYLTPLECERLQGFPDNWTDGVSDTQRYKCLGNAVTVNVVSAIIDKLKTSLNYDMTK